MSQWPSLTMFSVPMVSTWSLVERYKLLIDCGDGASSWLGSKIHKVNVIALTHAHRDHLGGLLQFLNLRGGGGNLQVVYPQGSQSFAALAEFLARFDEETSGKVLWTPVLPADSIELTNQHRLEAFASDHLPFESSPKALGYRIIHRQDKVKDEYRDAGSQIPHLVQEFGHAQVFSQVLSNELTVCGDGLPMDAKVAKHTKCLIMECTFLQQGESNRSHRHVSLEEAFDFVSQAKPEQVVFHHISVRYSKEDIDAAFTRYQWPCPIEIVYPSQVLKLG